ncbi:MAG: GNAT family N-acetyltransferase [Candidatus Syntrophonatronum acetioxidans]|uniref:GNAT family N-acetyltransferase n=1 Tax=Candidatus Syntrophonatronum acetioxidans TaxID=1795816 RepID=A0A424YBX9_9FIRM|nr:MAG: GNAT family N-acetyltransferase [Candidatus Syntrophonatronum acetioxidans]
MEKTTSSEIEIRQAEEGDIPQIAFIFLHTFERTVHHIFGDELPRIESMEDIFLFIYRMEPSSLFVAREGRRVVGYLICPQDVKALWSKALLKGYVFKWAWKWVCGEYGFGLAPLRFLLINKFHFMSSTHNFRSTSVAQILSIAVLPEYRDQGLASRLMEKGFLYLQSLGVPEIKLEVRPKNKAGKRLYEKMGFQEVGVTEDTQGQWIVMVKDLAPISGNNGNRPE